MTFEELVEPIEREHWQHAEAALDTLVGAANVEEAWRAWRRLEQAWETIAPVDRFILKADARERLLSAPDGLRRLAVVERLPD